MTDLVLWRHGQTDYNATRRVQGRVDIALNEVGLAQAEAAAPRLAALVPTRIVSSPLARARVTAEALARLAGLGVEVEPELAERSFGAWEGLTGVEIQAGWPEQFAVWRSGGDPQGVDVEPRAQVAARVGGALERLAADAGEGEVVVAVAHGAATTLGATHLLGLDPSSWFGLRGMDNCHHAVLRSGGRDPGWMLVAWNEGAVVPMAGPGGFLS